MISLCSNFTMLYYIFILNINAIGQMQNNTRANNFSLVTQQHVGSGINNGASGSGGANTGMPHNNEINVMKEAVNEFANQLSGTTESKKMIGTDPNGNRLICTSAKSGIEGNGTPQENLAKKKELCLVDAKKKSQLAQNLVKKMQKKDQCVVKVNAASVLCTARKVLCELVGKSVYNVKVNKNIVTMLKNGQAIFSVVVEKLRYNFKKKRAPSKEKLEKANIDVKFNELGGLLSQEGEIPHEKAEDPCSVCMTKLTEKANTMEGNVDDCSYSCDSNMLTSFLKPGNFTEIKEDPGQKKEGEEAADHDKGGEVEGGEEE